MAQGHSYLGSTKWFGSFLQIDYIFHMEGYFPLKREKIDLHSHFYCGLVFAMEICYYRYLS